MKQSVKNNIIELFGNHFNESVSNFEEFPPSTSYREYCRLTNASRSVIGVFNADVKENEAFLYFSKHFRNNNIYAPEVYAVNEDKTVYIIEDLGDTTLFQFLTTTREAEGFSDKLVAIYKKVVKELPRIQVLAGKDIDYSYCYPRAAFDKQSMMWDLNYFKYHFLKLAKIPLDEQALEDDFLVFSNYLFSASNNYFLYRDFQSRNVMLKGEDICFIDFQGGRKGPLQYDIASLLYDGKADIPQSIREELLDYYLLELKKYIKIDEAGFKDYFKGFVLIRIMQAMGAYGFRGFYEKKEHFLKSIPYAMDNLQFLLQGLNLPIRIPELIKVLTTVSQSEILREIGRNHKGLTVRVTSFSYKKGIPDDLTGNGGGFVFDCRAINNPGRIKQFKELTGKDKAVQEFLINQSKMNEFMELVFKLVGLSVRNYFKRGFSSLAVNFGCTGGQHRSVFAAEKMAEYLKDNFPVNVILSHREQIL